MQNLPRFAAAALLCSASAAAQVVAPSPLVPDGFYAPAGLPKLATALERVAALSGLDHVLLTAVPFENGAVDLLLTRVPHELHGFNFLVDGQPAPLLDGLDLSVWKGTVQGAPDSDVLLSFSNAGTRGWVKAGGELVHYLPQPGADGSWQHGYVIAATDEELLALGATPDFECQAEQVPLRGFELDGIPAGPGAPKTVAGGTPLLYGCKIAIETDFQLNQVFGGSLAAETAYVTSLWAAVADRYQEQVSTLLSFPYVKFYTTPADPWSTPDGGGDSGAMLDEFLNAWHGAIPGGAQLGHFMSGADLGGGIAYLSALCDTAQDFSFAVSGNLDGQVPFPITVNPFNWDFMVTAHETGHNFGSPHTHDFVPPIDQCAFGICITDGTLMSYCHLCPGGMLNITTYFHPLCVDVIKAHVASCLDIVVGITALPPSILAPGVPTNLTAEVDGSPVGSPLLSYRFDPAAAFSTLPMSVISPGKYGATLPPAACSDAPEFFFSFVDALGGPQETPVFSPEVGNQTELFHDDFQGDLGWTAGVAGDTATTGIWVRNDPLGTAAQPSAGVAIGAGQNCFFTGQGTSGGSVGENDVDGGKTTLLSPAFNLSAGDARLGYWRWYSNNAGSSPGADVFQVDVSNNGTTWVNVETVGPTGPETQGGWFYHEFDVGDFVSPTATVRVRFVAADAEPGSIVEAAVDEVRVFRVECNFCQPSLGFGGPGSATLSVCGPVLKPGNTATLTLAGGPAGAPAWVGYSLFSNPTPLLGGTLVPIPPAGFGAFVLSGAGSVTFPVVGGATVPTTLYVQGVVLNSGSPQFLITNAVAVEYLP
jgi:hypothetical protein